MTNCLGFLPIHRLTPDGKHRLRSQRIKFQELQMDGFGSLVLIRIQTNINEAEKGKSPR